MLCTRSDWIIYRSTVHWIIKMWYRTTDTRVQLYISNGRLVLYISHKPLKRSTLWNLKQMYLIGQFRNFTHMFHSTKLPTPVIIAYINGRQTNIVVWKATLKMNKTEWLVFRMGLKEKPMLNIKSYIKDLEMAICM